MMAPIARRRFSFSPRCLLFRKSTTIYSFSSKRSDPTAKRPNRLCDPYGQGGRPMDAQQALDLLRSTLHSDWSIQNDFTLLQRRFRHDDYGKGARFVQTIAAAAEQQAHFPRRLQLERTVAKSGTWNITTVVECQTVVLRGLSINDFHLAMMIDVETDRPDIRSLLAVEATEQA